MIHDSLSDLISAISPDTYWIIEADDSGAWYIWKVSLAGFLQIVGTFADKGYYFGIHAAGWGEMVGVAASLTVTPDDVDILRAWWPRINDERYTPLTPHEVIRLHPYSDLLK